MIKPLLYNILNMKSQQIEKQTADQIKVSTELKRITNIKNPGRIDADLDKVMVHVDEFFFLFLHMVDGLVECE